MSTFSGLNTAYSGLVASRTGIEVTGQNIANAKTAGYTRQRVTQDAMNPLAATGRISTRLAAAGQGVTVTGIDRIGDVFSMPACARRSARPATRTFAPTR